MKTRFFLIVLTLLILLTSCSAGSRDIFDFAEHDATFTLTFSSEMGEIVCDCTRAGEKITAEITSPERSRGIRIISGGGGTVIIADGVQIPLSNDAAERFTVLFDVMFRGSDGAEIRMSADGEFTEAVYEDGILTLSREGLPVSVNVGRAVKISNYNAQK